MSSQHLSDEAIAAFADGVLSGHARERASRHTAKCPECAYAVAVQREAVWALRAAPAPSLPAGLLDRLRSVPSTTPIRVAPTAVGPDGSAMFAAFGTMLTTAALVPPRSRQARSHRVRPIVMTVAAVAAAGVVAVASGAPASGRQPTQTRQGPTTQVDFVQPSAGVPAVMPIDMGSRIGR